jgi:hypothetical protein
MLDIWIAAFLTIPPWGLLHLVSYLKPCLHLQQSLCFSHGQHVILYLQHLYGLQQLLLQCRLFYFSFIILKRIKALQVLMIQFSNCFSRSSLATGPKHEFLSSHQQHLNTCVVIKSNVWIHRLFSLLFWYVQQLQLKQLLFNASVWVVFYRNYNLVTNRGIPSFGTS